jgi:hypothetical protein
MGTVGARDLQGVLEGKIMHCPTESFASMTRFSPMSRFWSVTLPVLEQWMGYEGNLQEPKKESGQRLRAKGWERGGVVDMIVGEGGRRGGRLTVVSPSGVGHVDGGALAKEAGEELEGKAATAGAGENLGGGHLEEESIEERTVGGEIPIFSYAFINGLSKSCTASMRNSDDACIARQAEASRRFDALSTAGGRCCRAGASKRCISGI